MGKDFLRKIVEDDLRLDKYSKVVTRFPPEPNGFPHIGHAKSISINFGIAKDYNGRCNLRMDDTNPTTEDAQYVEALKDAVEWLGFDWDKQVCYASDYFPKLYDYAVDLIKIGKAYVDSLCEDDIREYRGTITQPGRRSKYANRSPEENLELFRKMKNGEFPDGKHVLRAKIDMSAANMKMRDPLLYRIRNTHHFRTKDKWHVYPMYDFAHCLSDYIEGITHSFCTLEFESNRDVYNWILDTLRLEPPRPYQYEFARLAMNYTVMSKRDLRVLIKEGFVSGWDDPRMPTIAGLRRRGYTPESILTFCEQIGVAKANSVVDVSQLEFCIRDDLNLKAPRAMCVLDPIKVTITNYGEGTEELEASYYPHDVPKEGSRILPFAKYIYIDRGDFSENPPKEYFRLTPNQPVRLKHAYIISFQEAVKDDNNNIVEIKVVYHADSKSGQDTSGLKVKSAIQWVEAASAKKAEIRLYDRLYKTEFPQGVEDLNPDSFKVIDSALIEPSIINDKPDKRFQFERLGYFYIDPIDYTDETPVFNRIVTLKDSWAKKNKSNSAQKQPELFKKEQIDGDVVPLTAQQQKVFDSYTVELGLNSEIANTLARDKKLSKIFSKALCVHNNPVLVANIVTNEVARELKQNDVLKFTHKDIAKLAKMIDDQIISVKIAKQIFEKMSDSGTDPAQIVKNEGLEQISDPKVIEAIVCEVIKNNPDNANSFRDGNVKLLGFFVGQVLKATGGKANPQVVNRLITEKLQ